MKAKRCPITAFRKIARGVHEAARDVARHERKKVEMLLDPSCITIYEALPGPLFNDFGTSLSEHALC